MVIPLPQVAISPTPTDYALSCRNYFYGAVFWTVFVSFFRMFMMLDIMGGFMCCVVAMVGYYCLREDTIDMQCLLTWGMVSGVQGILDLVLEIDRHVKMGFVFSGSLSPAMNIALGILWTGPLVMVSLLA